jgi:hypothetical protein
MTFIGYADGLKAYRLLDTMTNRVYISRDVKFDETCNKQVPDQMNETEETNVGDGKSQCRGSLYDFRKIEADIQSDDEIAEATDDVTDECVNDHELPPDEAEGTVRLSSCSTKGIPPRRLIETCNLTFHDQETLKKQWLDLIRRSGKKQ